MIKDVYKIIIFPSAKKKNPMLKLFIN